VSTPLLAFAKRIADAQRQFIPGDCASWLAFYEAKEAAYGELLSAQPEVSAIKDEDFWRYVQNMPAAQWLPILEREIKRIGARWVCRDCRAPMEQAGICPDCLKARRLESLRRYRERQRERAGMVRRCPDCGTKLEMQRQRFCQPCRTSRRRELKRRSKRRQLTCKTPSEKMKQFSIPVQEADRGFVSQLTVPPNPMMKPAELV
jgi:hypothetical protein